MAWELDWAHPKTTGTFVWARNLTAKVRSARVWHLVGTGYMRDCGFTTPTYRSDSWEIDWAKRNGKFVWGRNAHSKNPPSREWHWIDFHTVQKSGLSWKPARAREGRQIIHGYAFLFPSAMTKEEVRLVSEHNLWSKARSKKPGGRKVAEHRLVALKKYGSIPDGCVIRHLNGIKMDNRPENLLRGTTAENNMDHDKARRMAMYWREQYEALLGRIRSKRQNTTGQEVLDV